MKAMQEGRDEGRAEGRENYASDLHVFRMYLKSIGKYDDAERAADNRSASLSSGKSTKTRFNAKGATRYGLRLFF